ncbi:MAG: type II secretion system F family protein [Gammaproteobacteria bacterium]|nr:type II secretion system F family protein [Gammaproteobacteria bacterium]
MSTPSTVNKLKRSSKKTSNLYSYNYTGIDSRGKKIKGECRGKTVSAVKAQLKGEGITVKKIYKSKNIKFGKSSIKVVEITLLTRQLATMLASGVPLIQSLDVCIRAADNPKISEMLTQIRSSIESGHSFSESLALYPKQFNSLFRNLLAVGESTGTLDVMLIRVAEHQEKIEKLRAKFKKALFYPSAVLIVSLAVTVILLIYVVPQFESMFANFNAKLPWFTQMILDVSRWLQAYWFYILVGTVTAGYFGSKYVQSSKKAKTFIDNLLLKLPLIGKIVNNICLARFTRTLNTMLKSGIPLLNCLPASAIVVDNEVYRQAITDIKEEVESGQSLNRAMHNSDIFNHMIIQMVSIGESSGTLDEMLLKLAELYEEDVNNTVENLSSIIEPVIIVVLSIVVGSLIIAMYLPIFTLGSVV